MGNTLCDADGVADCVLSGFTLLTIIKVVFHLLVFFLFIVFLNTKPYVGKIYIF